MVSLPRPIQYLRYFKGMRGAAVFHSVATEIWRLAYEHAMFDVTPSLGRAGEIPSLPARVAEEIVQVTAILTSSTGATSGFRTSLVDWSRRFHLYAFDDEQGNDVFKEVLVVLRCERDTILLHDLSQGLEEWHKDDVQGPVIGVAGF